MKNTVIFDCGKNVIVVMVVNELFFPYNKYE